MRQLGFGHARPVVADVYLPLLLARFAQAQLDAAAFWAVGHGVAQHIVKRTVEITGVAQYLRRFRHAALPLQLLLFLRRQLLVVVEQLLQKRHQQQRLFFHLHIGGFQPRQGE